MEVLERGAQPRAVLRPAERERAGQHLLGARADGEQQRVVGQLAAVVGVDAVRGRVDRAQAAEPQLQPAVGGEAREREALGGTAAERLGHRDRAIHERLLVAEQGDVNAVAGEALDRERGLERRRATAGDQQLGHARQATSVPAARHPGATRDGAP